MPIYEFRCAKCGDLFEILVIKGDGTGVEMVCPKCKSEDIERVLSTTNYAMGSGGSSKVSSQTRNCSSGSCTTYEIPGVA